jgi:hypothetical protein
MRRVWLGVLALALVGCEIQITGPTIDNNNNNNNNNQFDIHDLVNFVPVPNPSAPVPAPGGGTEIPTPLPSSAQATATAYAAANPLALARSCQATYGESAWLFLDGLVARLKSSDARWGYNIKSTDGTISRDVIAYRGTGDATGSWAVDVIIDHCGTPSFGWNVLGFDPNAQWAATR